MDDKEIHARGLLMEADYLDGLARKAIEDGFPNSLNAKINGILAKGMRDRAVEVLTGR